MKQFEQKDPFQRLYDDISARKNKPEDYAPYTGGNGRIDRAVDLILSDVKFPKGGAILDVGGATGNLGYALRDHYDYRVVLEISDVCSGPARAKDNIFILGNVDIDGLPFEEETFDVVCALDFIEHILDPEKFAEECHRVLKPNGRVLINTPNIQYWKHLESLVCQGDFPHTSGDTEVYHGGHTAFYNMQDMARIFRRYQDHQMHTEGLTPDAPPPIWVQLCQKPDLRRQLAYPDLIFSAGHR